LIGDAEDLSSSESEEMSDLAYAGTVDVQRGELKIYTFKKIMGSS
jgi:hypothetical protein